MRLLACLIMVGIIALSTKAPAQNEEALTALVQLLGQNDDPQFQLDVLKGMSEGLKGRRGLKMPAGWEDVAAKLTKSPNAQIRELAQSLSLTFGSASAMGALRKTLIDANADAAMRRNALQALVQAKDPALPSVLQGLLSDPALRAAATRGLAAYDDPQTADAILKVYNSLNQSEKKDALNTLVARNSYAKALLVAVEKKAVPTRDLSADIVRQLRTFKDEEINKQVQKLWGVARETEADKVAEIAKYKRMIEIEPAGDPSRGRAVFARTCQQCHTLFGEGGKVGPDITGSNRGDLDYILLNAIDPNAVIPNEYRTSTLETKDDRVITGIVTKQDENAVTIVTANETVLVPRGDVKSLQQGEVSMMPEGLLQALSNAEVRDLVAYLKSPAQVPMAATADNIQGFFNGKDLTGWDGNTNLWSVENGEIVGKSAGLKNNEFLKNALLLGDFRLVLKVKLVPNKENSGVQLRSAIEPGGAVRGYQADIGEGWWGKLYEEHGRALLWDKSGESHVKRDDWNTYEIVAVGTKIKTAINGKLCVDLDDPQGARQGITAFQLHAGGPMEVRFKDFKVELDPKLELTTAN
ncbi:MAG TPA: family 16 glycoside hydrolase [Candidatus Binatia bacterium]|nr:family 16 glycoside hydrolase [Candidatus Binatia bacterium]